MTRKDYRYSFYKSVDGPWEGAYMLTEQGDYFDYVVGVETSYTSATRMYKIKIDNYVWETSDWADLSVMSMHITMASSISIEYLVDLGFDRIDNIH